jgi:hypothetical protein
MYILMEGPANINGRRHPRDALLGEMALIDGKPAAPPS